MDIKKNSAGFSKFKPKIALVGAGNIGGTAAHIALMKQLGNLVLFDLNADFAKAKALDLLQCRPITQTDISIIGTSDYQDIANSDVVIVTAGFPRKPGMSRDDLLEKNASVMQTVGQAIAQYCPNAFVICVTNPLDAMVSVLHQAAKLPAHKIVGMAGVLDSARFRYFLAEALDISVQQVQAYVLGGHGDSMVPLTQLSQIAGLSLEQCVKQKWLSQTQLDQIIERTRQGGGELVQLYQNGSAYFAPASAAISMAESYLLDLNNILPCAAQIKPGQYGLKLTQDLFVGVPVKINQTGVSDIIEVPLTSQEFELFQSSVDAVQALTQRCQELLKSR